MAEPGDRGRILGSRPWTSAEQIPIVVATVLLALHESVPLVENIAVTSHLVGDKTSLRRCRAEHDFSWDPSRHTNFDTLTRPPGIEVVVVTRTKSLMEP